MAFVSFDLANPVAPLPWEGTVAVVSAAGGGSRDVVQALRALTNPPPFPGGGRTRALWEFLATVAAVDLTAARVTEPHLDALAILDQAGVPAAAGLAWGVFAAESSGMRLVAKRNGGGWVLDGTKPWCSLARSLDRAVVTAHVPGGRRTFSVDLTHRGVSVIPTDWVARGLRDVPSGPVRFDAVPAIPIGETGWYLERPGFAWGGIGVSACWYGAATALLRTLKQESRRSAPDQLSLAWLGEADRTVRAAGVLLARAAAGVDGHPGPGVPDAAEAFRVRGCVAAAVQRVLEICGQALGPTPLAFDEEHAKRAADLELYLRQHHGARDDAALGAHLLEDGAAQ